MRPIATDGVAWSICLCTCLSVGDVREHCKNGRTDQDAVWVVTRVGPRNHVLDGVEIHPRETAVFGGCPAY